VPNAGSLLLARIVEAACRGGCTIVDLLRGDHGYKRAWTDRADTVYEIVWPSTLLGRAAVLAYAMRWRAAQSKRLRDLRARWRRVGDRRESTPGKEMATLTERVHVGERAER
jgi:CelD/BcsL family acetyltransferase involved in cellulose biosynthesis